MKTLWGRKWIFSVALLLAAQQVACGQIMYRWLRNGQELGARSNVSVSVTAFESAQDGGNLPRVVTCQDFLFLADARNVARDARGGEGGGGGDDGNLFVPFSGLNGRDFVPLDGADGFGALGGQGGAAGDNGQAQSGGTAVAIDELNPDFQTTLSYAWIHNQWGDLNLRAAGGGGGGGAGTDGYEYDPQTQQGIFYQAGSGGDGGRGNDARGSVTTSQDSDVVVSATCVVDPAISPPPSSTPAIDCSITLDMGWVSAPNHDWNAGGGPGSSPWERGISMTITAGASCVWIVGGPTGQIDLWAIDDFGVPYFKTSADVLESDTGSFGIGPGEIGITRVGPGAGASIVTPPNGISSVLTGEMSAEGGQGGGGAFPWTSGGAGADGGLGLGAPGGDGGEGGDPRPVDTDGDGQNDGSIAGGGDGGDGGDGDHVNEHKDGIYQGLVMISMG